MGLVALWCLPLRADQASSSISQQKSLKDMTVRPYLVLSEPDARAQILLRRLDQEMQFIQYYRCAEGETLSDAFGSRFPNSDRELEALGTLVEDGLLDSKKASLVKGILEGRIKLINDLPPLPEDLDETKQLPIAPYLDGHWDRAATRYEKKLDKHRRPWAWRYYADCLWVLGRKREAMEAYETSLQIDPKNTILAAWLQAKWAGTPPSISFKRELP
jgi:tetratricopeptide (TPR) repeat protein